MSQGALATQGPIKNIHIFVDTGIEFTVSILNDQLTCGWLLSEVTRRYHETLNQIK